MPHAKPSPKVIEGGIRVFGSRNISRYMELVCMTYNIYAHLGVDKMVSLREILGEMDRGCLIPGL